MKHLAGKKRKHQAIKNPPRFREGFIKGFQELT
jgi:hypothetical protein